MRARKRFASTSSSAPRSSCVFCLLSVRPDTIIDNPHNDSGGGGMRQPCGPVERRGGPAVACEAEVDVLRPRSACVRLIWQSSSVATRPEQAIGTHGTAGLRSCSMP